MDNLAFISRYEAILHEKHIAKMAFYKDCGISTAAASQWRTGKSSPSWRTIARIAAYLGTTPEYLLTGQSSEAITTSATMQTKKTPPSMSEGEAYWAERLNRLTPSDQALVGAIVAKLQENPEATRSGIGLLLGAVQSAPRGP